MDVSQALAAIDSGCQELSLGDRMKYCLRGQLRAYAEFYDSTNHFNRYKLASINGEIEGIEVKLNSQINDKWSSISYLDKLLVDDFGNLAIMDHKMLSRWDFHPMSADMRVLFMDPQVRMYQMVAYVNGLEVTHHIHDVSVNCYPTQQKIGKTFLQEIEAKGTYRGFEISEDSIDHALGIDDAKETYEMLEATVYSKIMAKPEKFFGQPKVPMCADRVMEVAKRLQQICTEMDARAESGAHWKNPKHCKAFGKTCEYLPLCEHSDEPDSQNWLPRGQSRDDSGSHMDRISHSRIECDLGCHKKHYWRYLHNGTGIEPAVKDDTFYTDRGTVWHSAMDVLYRTNCGVVEVAAEELLAN